MARKTKSHILDVESVARLTLCGRTGVKLSKKPAEATCDTCLSTASAKEKRPPVVGRRAPEWTEMQLAFAAHPLVSLNPQQAAREVGYSDSFAKKKAHSLRKRMAPLIIEHQERAKMRSAISAAKVQTELACMGFANVLDYFDISDNGNARPKQLNELTRDQAAAIQEVEVIDYQDPDTGETFFVIGKLKLADKRQNLVELGKTIGMFNKITIEDKRSSTLLLNEVPTEALADAERLLMDAVAAGRNAKANAEALPGEYTQIEGPKVDQKKTND
jgi:hypothetical protein